MSVHCDHSALKKPSKATIKAAMTLAKARAVENKQRWTPPRQRALELLLEAGGPVKVYDLLGQFQEGVVTAPPTVYRALDTLVTLGLAHKIASLNAYTACHLHVEDHSASFLICDCCGAAEEFATPTVNILAEIRERSEFKPTHVTIEAHGRCPKCQT